MKKISVNLIIFFISILLFLFVDFFFGNLILTKLNINRDNSFRISNNYYQHGFKKNYSTKNAYWGPYKYIFCSNHLGLRSNCSYLEKNKYDYAFIGDSQTEGVGLNYEDTIAGLFSDKTNKSVLNLGIVSASPSIYFKRIDYFLKQDVYFNELFMFIDLSDIHDEIGYNENLLNSENSYVCRNNLENKTISEKEKKISIFKLKYILRDNFKISYFILHTLWWKFNFKKTSKNYSLNYLDKDFYRSAWTYNSNLKEYRSPDCLEYLISSTKNVVENIYNLLNSKNINLSIIVAPWPGTILHDKKNSKHVKIWEKFCNTRCKNFYNLFPYFFKHAKQNGPNKTIEQHFFKYDVHYNKYANNVIANYLVDTLN